MDQDKMTNKFSIFQKKYLMNFDQILNKYERLSKLDNTSAAKEHNNVFDIDFDTLDVVQNDQKKDVNGIIGKYKHKGIGKSVLPSDNLAVEEEDCLIVDISYCLNARPNLSAADSRMKNLLDEYYEIEVISDDDDDDENAIDDDNDDDDVDVVADYGATASSKIITNYDDDSNINNDNINTTTAATYNNNNNNNNNNNSDKDTLDEFENDDGDKNRNDKNCIDNDTNINNDDDDDHTTKDSNNTNNNNKNNKYYDINDNNTVNNINKNNNNYDINYIDNINNNSNYDINDYCKSSDNKTKNDNITSDNNNNNKNININKNNITVNNNIDSYKNVFGKFICVDELKADVNINISDYDDKHNNNNNNININNISNNNYSNIRCSCCSNASKINKCSSDGVSNKYSCSNPIIKNYFELKVPSDDDEDGDDDENDGNVKRGSLTIVSQSDTELSHGLVIELENVSDIVKVNGNSDERLNKKSDEYPNKKSDEHPNKKSDEHLNEKCYEHLETKFSEPLNKKLDERLSKKLRNTSNTSNERASKQSVQSLSEKSVEGLSKTFREPLKKTSDDVKSLGRSCEKPGRHLRRKSDKLLKERTINNSFSFNSSNANHTKNGDNNNGGNNNYNLQIKIERISPPFKDDAINLTATNFTKILTKSVPNASYNTCNKTSTCNKYNPAVNSTATTTATTAALNVDTVTTSCITVSSVTSTAMTTATKLSTVSSDLSKAYLYLELEEDYLIVGDVKFPPMPVLKSQFIKKEFQTVNGKPHPRKGRRATLGSLELTAPRLRRQPESTYYSNIIHQSMKKESQSLNERIYLTPKRRLHKESQLQVSLSRMGLKSEFTTTSIAATTSTTTTTAVAAATTTTTCSSSTYVAATRSSSRNSRRCNTAPNDACNISKCHQPAYELRSTVKLDIPLDDLSTFDEEDEEAGDGRCGGDVSLSDDDDVLYQLNTRKLRREKFESSFGRTCNAKKKLKYS
ncbi:hypothetical protein HELRODRAFT_191488 [Helobdella robusta]|uniref:Uncharacterized protein n=1 Tax=Helobdella robusta TaxID=6412 RepID=T1FT12_HELRO|nr:hypothetical protein HELRODRAFT_191488 [Helobdella robusta]ESO04870.1 hypothetical protein HELRODRAFT_191488 [Helobdella robusta]